LCARELQLSHDLPQTIHTPKLSKLEIWPNCGENA
jgi:hypothetical protein